MGVKRVTTVTVTCDECEHPIDLSQKPLWVDASVYGVAFHLICWQKIGGPRVARVLYLDDISLRRGEEEERVDRAMEPLP
jgi:hypothetical protein